MRNRDMVKNGDWIFTCRMQPVRFSHFNKKDPLDYDQEYLATLSEEEYKNFIYDDFETIDGSNHSFKHCTCKVVSECYANWFLEHKIDQLYEKYKMQDDSFSSYENEVREICTKKGIAYEGI